MLLKRVEEKKRQIADHINKRNAIEERLKVLKSRVEGLEKSIKQDEAQYFNAAPATEVVADEPQPPLEGDAKKGRKRKKAAKTPVRIVRPKTEEDEMEKKAMAQLKDEIADLVANGTIPSDYARLICNSNIRINPYLEDIGRKFRQLTNARKEYEQLSSELKLIQEGELDLYILDTAPFLLEHEKERHHEQKAIVEMSRDRPDLNALSMYLEVLPKTEEDLRIEKLKRAALSVASTSGRAAPKKKHKSRKKVAQPGGVTPGNINSNIPVADVNQTQQTSQSLSEKGGRDILTLFQTPLALTATSTNPVTKERDIYSEYLDKVEKDPSRKLQTQEQTQRIYGRSCPDFFCQGEMVESFLHDHKVTCSRCGYCEYIQPDVETGSFDEQNPQQQSSYAYQKKNHFRDWLAKAQGLENRTIPPLVYDALRNELKRMQIKKAEDVTRKLLHDLLKKLNMSTYYHNVSKIHYHLTGQRPPEFTQEEVEIMNDMFLRLEPVYEELKPKNRTNFFSYEYVINKFCQIQEDATGNAEWMRYYRYFKMLKGPDKLQATDQIWKECCKRMGWKFIRSE